MADSAVGISIPSRPEGLANFEWEVFADYTITNGFLGPSENSLVRWRYHPSQYPRLATDFAKIESGDERSVLGFVRNWGPLGSQKVEFGEHCYEETSRIDTGAVSDSVGWISAHAHGVRICLRVWDLTREDSPDALAGYLLQISNRPSLPITGSSYGPEGLVLRFNYGVKRAQVSAEVPAAGKTWPDLAAEVIRQIVQPNLESFRLNLEVRPSNSGRPALALRYNCASLIEVIYWQLARIVTGHIDGEDVRRCPECKNLFIRTDGRQQFCPPEPLQGEHAQSLCSQRARKRAYRDSLKDASNTAIRAGSSVATPKSGLHSPASQQSK